jgi:hypothetical protein
LAGIRTILIPQRHITAPKANPSTVETFLCGQMKMLANAHLSHVIPTSCQSTMSLVREPQGVALSEHRVPTDPNDEDYEEFVEDQITELHLAAQDGHKKDVESLLEAHADPNTKTRFGWTALHYAAKAGHKEILLKAGASVDPTDDNHRTPLNYSIEELHDDVTLLLLNSRANPSTKNILGGTPLHDAAKYGLENLAQDVVG